ncbi:hypothetical protein R3P38DRAFT_3094553 [Favolaschia claudopus]|uniref:Uncharacterized protein n=1 Tax=Favolaschia claudopus TaxID=2862362 RepID=A0AAV9ZR69_9AGAR
MLTTKVAGYKGKTVRSWAELPTEAIQSLATWHLNITAPTRPLPATWDFYTNPEHKHRYIPYPEYLIYVAGSRCEGGWRLEQHPFWTHAIQCFDPYGACAHFAWFATISSGNATSSFVAHDPPSTSRAILHTSCLPCRINFPQSNTGLGNAGGDVNTIDVNSRGSRRARDDAVRVARDELKRGGMGHLVSSPRGATNEPQAQAAHFLQQARAVVDQAYLDTTGGRERLAGDTGLAENEDDCAFPGAKATCRSCREGHGVEMVSGGLPVYCGVDRRKDDDGAGAQLTESLGTRVDMPGVLVSAYVECVGRVTIERDGARSSVDAIRDVPYANDACTTIPDECYDEDSSEPDVHHRMKDGDANPYVPAVHPVHWSVCSDPSAPRCAPSAATEGSVRAIGTVGWIDAAITPPPNPMPCREANNAFVKQMRSILLPVFSNVVRRLVIDYAIDPVEQPPPQHITQVQGRKASSPPRFVQARMTIAEVVQQLREEVAALREIPHVPQSIDHLEACTPLYQCRCSICERATLVQEALQGETSDATKIIAQAKVSFVAKEIRAGKWAMRCWRVMARMIRSRLMEQEDETIRDEKPFLFHPTPATWGCASAHLPGNCPRQMEGVRRVHHPSSAMTLRKRACNLQGDPVDAMDAASVGLCLEAFRPVDFDLTFDATHVMGGA